MGENGLAAAAAGKVAASLLALRPPNMPRDGGRHDRGDCATVERWADFLVGLCSTSRALVRTKYGRIRRIVRHPKSNKKPKAIRPWVSTIAGIRRPFAQDLRSLQPE